MGNCKLGEVKISSVCGVVCTAVIWRVLIQNMCVVLSVFYVVKHVCCVVCVLRSATCVLCCLRFT